MALALFVLLGALLVAASLRWVWLDAQHLGYNPRGAVALTLLCWPLGLSLWLMVRSGLHLAPSGGGSAWG